MTAGRWVGTWLAAAALVAIDAPARADAGPPIGSTSSPGAPSLEAVVRARPEPLETPREDWAAAASVVIPGNDPRALDDLGSLLLEVPGVTVVRTGSIGTYSTLALRGANPDEVRIYLDGVPLNIAAGGAVDASTLPLGDVERVEVYRGTTPLAFGESALGGIVSITTRTPGARRLTARVGVGSFGTTFGDVTAGGRAGRLRLYLGLHGLRSLGDYPYRNDNMTPLNLSDDVYGPRQNNDVSQGDGVARAALTLVGRRVLTLGLVGFGRDQGLVSTGGNPTFHSRFRTGRAVGTLRYESRDDLGPGGRLSGQVFASGQRDRLDDSAAELGGSPILSHATTASAGASVYLSRPLGEWVRAAAVLEGRGESFRSSDELAAAAQATIAARRGVGVAGGELDVHLRPLDLDVIPSMRAEYLRDEIAAEGATASASPTARLLPVARLGILRPLGRGAALRANGGRYARAPSFLELFGNGTNRLLGNGDLRAERGYNADLGLSIDRHGEHMAIVSRTTAFAALADDLIDWQFSPWGQARADNIGRARIWGVEQEVRLAAARHFRITAQATYLSATNLSNDTSMYGRQLPFHPRLHGYARPELTGLALPGGFQIGAYADADLRAWAFSDRSNSKDVGTRVLVGAGVVGAHPKSHLRLTASAVNLTNTRQLDVDSWSLPGPSVFLALAYSPLGEGDPADSSFDPQ